MKDVKQGNRGAVSRMEQSEQYVSVACEAQPTRNRCVTGSTDHSVSQAMLYKSIRWNSTGPRQTWGTYAA